MMLAWMDLEMTGLEPHRHVIVEIATIITDDNLNVVAEGPDLVIHASPEELAQMGEFVTEMHTKSGLLPAIVASSVSVRDAEIATLEFMKSHIRDARSVPLCGNSIGTDRRFLEEYMPELEAFFQRKEFISSLLRLVSNPAPKLLLRNLPIEGDQDIANVEDSRLNSHQARLNSYSGNGTISLFGSAWSSRAARSRSPYPNPIL